LVRAPYPRELIADLPAPKLMVRLLTLPAGSEIGEHNDAGSNFRFGSLRLHVPVVTHPDVIMMIDGERMSWRPGELWWGDFSRRHWLRNNSPITRGPPGHRRRNHRGAAGTLPAELVAQWRESPGGISEHRQSVAVTPAELERFRCGFRLPSALSPLFGRGAGLQHLARDTDAVCRPDGEQLVILLDGEPACALRRTGARTFAVVGRPPGVFVEFDSAQDPSMATFVICGVPEDLYAAQLGFQQGRSLPSSASSYPHCGVREVRHPAAIASDESGAARSATEVGWSISRPGRPTRIAGPTCSHSCALVER
jgi:Aspartyl/Asparaginyl beta-hydroxylase